VKFLSLEVPVCMCEQQPDGSWKVERGTTTVKAIANKDGSASNAATVLSEHEELFKANSELCLAKNKEFEAYLSVPDYWQTRSPQKPQLAIQYAENLGSGKVGRSRWTLLLPHYRYGEAHKPNFLDYEKGNYRGIQVLRDNSKIIVWCKTEFECLRVINALKQYVDPDFLKGIKPPETTNSHKDYKEVPVTPTLCQFFPNGQKDAVPLWSKKLRDKK
jgi:collagen type III alpha